MAYPFADVKFPLTGREFGQPAKLEIRSAEFGHEIAIITLAGSSVYYPDFLTGAPVFIRYGTADATDTFVGYVDHVRPDTAQVSAIPAITAPLQRNTIVCVGATYPLKGGHQRVFRAATADVILQQIATSHGLAGDAEAHSRRLPMSAQAGLSDWAFLAKVAHSSGFTLLAERTTIRMKSPTRDLKNLAEQTLVFDAAAVGHAGKYPTEPHIHKFSAVLGEAVPGAKGAGRARRIMHAYDLRTKTVTQVVDETAAHPVLGSVSPGPVFTQYPVLVGHSTADHADALLGVREDTRWHITAEATIIGDARVRAGKMIYTRNLPSDYSGYWYVRAAVHTFTWTQQIPHRPGAYTVALSLGRDGSGNSIGAPSSYPKRILTEQLPSAIASRLTSGGIWKSASATPESSRVEDPIRPAFVDARLARR